MSELRIISNYQARPIVYGFELSEEEKKEFDYLEGEELETNMFVRYKNNVWDLSDFMRTGKRSPFPAFWHGYASDSFFSGTLIHLCEDDSDYVIMGWYMS